MDLELLKHAKEYISKMANSINPLNGEKVKDDDLIKILEYLDVYFMLMMY